jgi:hypothetical protein
MEFKVGQKFKICEVTYTYVGWDSDYNVFANLQAKSDSEARVLSYTNREIEDLIQEGNIVILK